MRWGRSREGQRQVSMEGGEIQLGWTSPGTGKYTEIWYSHEISCVSIISRPLHNKFDGFIFILCSQSNGKDPFPTRRL